MSNGSLLLEEKVLNAVKRMRSSHRSGVIFLAMITAIAWPTPHHRLRRSLSSRRSLLVSALSNYHQSLCKGSTATQRAPVARTQPTLPPSSLISLTFTATRQVLCFFPCTPRATALRQARVSGGNLQNCAPSAACGGAMTQESTVPPRSAYPSPKKRTPAILR